LRKEKGGKRKKTASCEGKKKDSPCPPEAGGGKKEGGDLLWAEKPGPDSPLCHSPSEKEENACSSINKEDMGVTYFLLDRKKTLAAKGGMTILLVGEKAVVGGKKEVSFLCDGDRGEGKKCTGRATKRDG